MKKKSTTAKKTIRSKMNISKEFNQEIQNRIRKVLSRNQGVWVGTMSELNIAITTGIRKSEYNSFWPKTPSVMRRVINTMIPSLSHSGVRTTFGRTTDHSRTRFVCFETR